MSPLPLLLLAILLATTSRKVFQLGKAKNIRQKLQLGILQVGDAKQEEKLQQREEQEQEQEQVQEQEQEQEQHVHPLVSWHAWQALSLVGVTGTLANGFLLHTFYRSSLIPFSAANAPVFSNKQLTTIITSSCLPTTQYNTLTQTRP